MQIPISCGEDSFRKNNKPPSSAFAERTPCCPPLLDRQEFHAHRRSYFDSLSGGCQAPTLLVDAEDHNIVGLLILGKQELSGWIDLEAAWGLALR